MMLGLWCSRCVDFVPSGAEKLTHFPVFMPGSRGGTLAEHLHSFIFLTHPPTCD